jgi:alcohol dehydrogenase
VEAGAALFPPFKDFYQFVCSTRVIAGRDLIDSAGFEFTKEGAERVLVVSDEVVRGTGLVDRVEAGIVAGGLEVAGVFDAVPQDSDIQAVTACAELAAESGANSLLAVGGGSVIDTMKAANVVFTHGGEPREWEGYLLLPREKDGAGKPIPLAPMAAIPTTAGTGSEVSWAAVVRDRTENLKFQIGDFTLFPDLAILDPAATETLPAKVAAATGMDAFTHAVEGYVSTEWSPQSDAFALQAIRLIRDNLERAVADPSDGEARGCMLVAANLAIQPVN